MPNRQQLFRARLHQAQPRTVSSEEGGGGGGALAFFQTLMSNRDTSQDCPTGDLPGWTFINAEDYLIPKTVGSYPDEDYPNVWCYPHGYLDTSDNGHYEPTRTLSVRDSRLIINMHTEDIEGTPTVCVAAVLPWIVNGSVRDQLYGRYAIRYRLRDPAVNFKIAWLLWPESNTSHPDGEIDWPEVNLWPDDTFVKGFMHWQDGETGSDQTGYTSDIKAVSGWHIAVIEWLPEAEGGLKFLMDGVLKKTFLDQWGDGSTKIPNTPMHWVIQSETALSGAPAPNPGVIAVLEVDWWAQWARAA